MSTDNTAITASNEEGGSELAAEVLQMRQLLPASADALLDDFDCLRFLRARKMDPRKAADMASAWAVWATTPLPGSTEGLTPLTILSVAEDPNEALFTRLAPYLMEGEDKEGHPIFWEKTGNGSAGFYELKQHQNHDQLLARHVRLQGIMECRLHHQSQKHGRRIEKLVAVNDYSNLSMYPDLDAIKFAIAVATTDSNNFPERLHKLIAINCPWYFSALFALVSPFADPVTLAKFVILGSNYQEDLKTYIDESQIPEEYGGTMAATWSWPHSPHSGASPQQIEAFVAARRARAADKERMEHGSGPAEALDDITTSERVP